LRLPARRVTAVAVALGAVLTACESGGGGRTASTPTRAADVVITVTVVGGKVATADDEVEIKHGQTVALTITSDRADEVHVHGYELEAALNPGKPTTIRFDADLPGKWEVELHDAHTVLVRLEVAN